jgi:hypothetical protein
MAIYPAQAAKRALVVLLRALAVTYGITLDVTRDSPAADVNRAFRKVSGKAHPDKGGATEDAQRLNMARDTWRTAEQKKENKESTKCRGAHPSKASPLQPSLLQAVPLQPSLHVVLPVKTETRKGYRIQGEATLLTYQSWHPAQALQAWSRFLLYVEASLAKWTARRFAATLETNTEGTCHLHLMLG